MTDRVYFFRANDAIKIGTSRSVKKRLKSLQTAHSEPLEYLGSVHGAAGFERCLHKKFAAYRLHGEWFKECEEILAWVSRHTLTPNSAEEQISLLVQENKALKGQIKDLQDDLKNASQETEIVNEIAICMHREFHSMIYDVSHGARKLYNYFQRFIDSNENYHLRNEVRKAIRSLFGLACPGGHWTEEEFLTDCKDDHLRSRISLSADQRTRKVLDFAKIDPKYYSLAA